jgi:hypothetical protein
MDIDNIRKALDNIDMARDRLRGQGKRVRGGGGIDIISGCLSPTKERKIFNNPLESHCSI